MASLAGKRERAISPQVESNRGLPDENTVHDIRPLASQEIGRRPQRQTCAGPEDILHQQSRAVVSAARYNAPLRVSGVGFLGVKSAGDEGDVAVPVLGKAECSRSACYPTPDDQDISFRWHLGSPQGTSRRRKCIAG
jgi:hypothetical protein